MCDNDKAKNKIIWFEKTVEYMYVLYNYELSGFKPLAGDVEKAGDLIKIKNNKFMLIEFKRDNSCQSAELDKFNEGSYIDAHSKLYEKSSHHEIIFGESTFDENNKNHELKLINENYFTYCNRGIKLIDFPEIKKKIDSINEIINGTISGDDHPVKVEMKEIEKLKLKDFFESELDGKCFKFRMKYVLDFLDKYIDINAIRSIFMSICEYIKSIKEEYDKKIQSKPAENIDSFISYIVDFVFFKIKNEKENNEQSSGGYIINYLEKLNSVVVVTNNSKTLGVIEMNEFIDTIKNDRDLNNKMDTAISKRVANNIVNTAENQMDNTTKPSGSRPTKRLKP